MTTHNHIFPDTRNKNIYGLSTYWSTSGLRGMGLLRMVMTYISSTVIWHKKQECIWLIDWLLFHVPLKNISLIWRRHHYRWRAAKFRPMLGAQGLWAGRDLYRATPAVTRSLGFSGLIRRTAPFSHLLRHTKGWGKSILTRILTGVV
jgi:hypothetical protein